MKTILQAIRKRYAKLRTLSADFEATIEAADPKSLVLACDLFMNALAAVAGTYFIVIIIDCLVRVIVGVK